MKKIILRISDSIDDETAVKKALTVIQLGKISKTSRGKQYCFHCKMHDGVSVSVDKRESGTHTFHIYQ